MRSRTAKRPRNRELRRWSTPSTFIAGVALFITLGGSAIAANGLIHAGDIAPGAVTSKAIRNGGVRPEDLSTKTRALLHAAEGVAGEKGDTGSTGAPGTNGANGPNGPNGANGIDGTDGTDGTNGTDGIDGTIAPLSATSGLTALPTASPPTTVVALGGSGGQLCCLGQDAAVPHGGWRYCGLRAESRRRQHRPSLHEDASRPCCDSGVAASCDRDDFALPAERRVRCADGQWLG